MAIQTQQSQEKSEQTRQQKTRSDAQPTFADLVDHLMAFDGPPEKFLLELLAVQCHVGRAQAGAYLRVSRQQEGGVEVISTFPPLQPGSTAPVWLAHAVEATPEVVTSGAPATVGMRGQDDMYGGAPKSHVVLIPLKGQGGVRAVCAFSMPTTDLARIEQSRQRLELTISLLSLYEMRLTLQRRSGDMNNLRRSLEVLATINDHRKFTAAAMAYVNQVATDWECDRVSLGFLKGRYVKLKALSHTEKFTRKMKLVQDLECAMEECVDQDIELIHPSGRESGQVTRATKELSKSHGQTTVCVLPLRHDGQAIGALTIERPLDKQFRLDEVETLRLTCELCTPWLYNRFEEDLWIGGKTVRNVRKGAGILIGPQYTWVKLLAVGILGFLLFATFVKGSHRIEAPFTVEAVTRQVVPAPFEGFLKAVYVEPGDLVIANETVLAEVDKRDLEKQLAAAVAEKARYIVDGQVALREGKQSDKQIADANIRQVEARVDLLKHRLDQATILSPVDGMVVTGDWTQKVGSPLKTGDMIFEVAPPKSLRAVLKVSEDDIAELNRNQHGEMSAASKPNDYVPFALERINPIAEVEDGKNVFKVRVRLLQSRDHYRPGMEGLGKIDVDRRPYIVLWTQKLVRWVRMQLWI